MKIIFNCVVNKRGGSIQNAANFISHARNDFYNEYLFLVSEPVYSLLLKWNQIDSRVISISHPLESSSSKRDVIKIEAGFLPDIIYTMAGPTYLKFKAMHVLGISDGFITHSKLQDFYYNQSFYKGSVFLFKTLFKGFLSRFSADNFIFQTETARAGYCKRFFLNKKNTAVVSNAIGKSFLDLESINIIKSYDKEVVIFCPFANYPHKDIAIIQRMLDAVIYDKSRFFLDGYKIKFKVTIEESDAFAKKINELNSLTDFICIENVGPYSYSDSLSLYNSSHVVFMPTILETFSTSYLEALATGRIVLTSDIASSREICGDAAIYFNPGDEVDALIKMFEIIKGNKVLDLMMAKTIVNHYGDYRGRYLNIIQALNYFKSK